VHVAELTADTTTFFKSVVGKTEVTKTSKEKTVKEPATTEASNSVEEIDADDEFDEDLEPLPTAEELIAEKRSAAAKKAAATKKKNKETAAAKKKAEKESEKETETVEAELEETDDLDDDLDDDGEDAEMVEVPTMERPDFMNTLKRYASKHPNGEQEGRKLASKVLKRDYDVDKFGELAEKDFQAMCDSLKTEIKSI